MNKRIGGKKRDAAAAQRTKCHTIDPLVTPLESIIHYYAYQTVLEVLEIYLNVCTDRNAF